MLADVTTDLYIIISMCAPHFFLSMSYARLFTDFYLYSVVNRVLPSV